MKRSLILLVAFMLGIGTGCADERKPKIDPKDWCYRIVTDGKVYRLQFHWTAETWGDCIPEKVYPTLEEANKWLVKAQLAAEDYADEQKKEWKPIALPNLPLGDRRTNAGSIYVTNLYYTNDVVFDRLTVGTNAQEYLDAAKYFKIMPDLVNLMVPSEICKVRGHVWGPNFGGIVQAMNWTAPHEERKCAICGKIESRSMPAWPTP